MKRPDKFQIYEDLHSSDPKEQMRGREMLVAALEGYIWEMIRKRFHFANAKGLEDDMFQAGVLGILADAMKYDPKQSELTTYFKKSAYYSISHFLNEQEGTGLTKYYATKVAHLSKAREKIAMEGREPSMEEIARMAGMKKEKAAELLLYLDAAPPISIFAEGIMEMLPEREKAAEEEFMEAETARMIREAVGRLPKDEAEMVRMRYGLEGRRERMIKDIAPMYGMNPDRAKYVIAKAVKKLRADKDIAELFPEKSGPN